MKIYQLIMRAVFVLGDALTAFLLACYAFLVVGPLGFLRGPLVLERFFWYIRVLVPCRMLSRGVRIGIDWRLGHFEQAIAQAEDVIANLEQSHRSRPNFAMRKRVLADLYTILARAYMHTGRIDEAMQVVLRAKKLLDMDRLLGLSGLDAKTAHLVRAGLAAGKLLDGSGLATLFVRTDSNAQHQTPPPPQRRGSSPATPTVVRRRAKKLEHDPSQGAQIIPFPENHALPKK